MLVGISVLIYLGRERTQVIGQKIGELDLRPLLNAQDGIEMPALEGKLVLLHFWGPWCPPCLHEYPEIIKLQHKYQDLASEVVIVSISCGADVPENVAQLASDTQEIVGEPGDGLPVYADPAQYSRVQVANLLGSRGFAYPTSILLNRELKVVDTWVGATRPGELDLAIENLRKSQAKGKP
jgi:thiol-disulfide isomerase/thioredoxin